MIDKDIEDFVLTDFLEAYEEDLQEEDLQEEDLQEEDLQEEDLQEESQTFHVYNTYSLQSSDSFLDSFLDDLTVSDISFLLIFSFCVFLFINFWCGGVKDV